MSEHPRSRPLFFGLGIWQKKIKVLPAVPIPERRRAKRVALKKRASLVASLGFQEMRSPCLILDCSQGGLRLRGTIRLKRGQLVEVIPEDDPTDHVRGAVVWVGKLGSASAGEAGLKTVIR